MSVVSSRLGNVTVALNTAPFVERSKGRLPVVCFVSGVVAYVGGSRTTTTNMIRERL